MDVVLVIVVGVGVEPDFLAGNDGGEDVAAVVQDGGRIDSAEVLALGFEELSVHGSEDVVGGQAVEVAAGGGQGVGQLVAVSLDADVVPGAGAVGVISQADDQVLDKAKHQAVGVSGVLEAGDEVFRGDVVVHFAVAGGPHRVVADGEGPLGSVIIGGPLDGHARNENAVVVLGQQAFGEVRGEVAVGAVVVVQIVQRGDVERIKHVIRVNFISGLFRSGFLSGSGFLGSGGLGIGLFRSGSLSGGSLGRGSFRSRGAGFIATAAGGQAQNHGNSHQQCDELLHFVSSLLDCVF